MALSQWTETTIGEQATLQRGFDITRVEQNPGDIPVVSSSGINSYHDTVAVKGPGVILGRKGVVGSVYYVASNYWPHDTTLWVKDFHGNSPRFVYYFFMSLAPQLANMDVGSANPTLNRNHIHPMAIHWPPIPEQEVIAGILGALDDKIELNRRMNQTLEGMAQAIFKSWFVDFDPVRTKAAGEQPSGLAPHIADLFPDEFEESELGEIPKGWQVGVLEDALDLLETGSRPRGGVRGILTGVPSIGAESIVGIGQFDFSKTKYVPVEFFTSMKKGHVESRDVLLYKDGGRPGEYQPHVSMFGDGFPFEEMCINEHVYRLRTNDTSSQPFLYFWLTSHLATDEMRVKGTGVAIPGLNSTAVRSLTMLFPSSKVLDQFSHLVDPLLASIFCNCNESRTLAALRDTLLPKLISGELRVPDAERFVGEAL